MEQIVKSIQSHPLFNKEDDGNGRKFDVLSYHYITPI
jgi:hypothetical protein